MPVDGDVVVVVVVVVAIFVVVAVAVVVVVVVVDNRSWRGDGGHDGLSRLG
jgi:heme/copper-type cytochrome/quinol oxidase subunit 2